jgi:amidase
MRRREVSSLELGEAAIARIEAHDGKLNAVVVRDFERARAAGRNVDQTLAPAEQKPLLGVPITEGVLSFKPGGALRYLALSAVLHLA